MYIRKFLILIIITLYSFGQICQGKMVFQRKIFMLWNEQIQKAPLIIRMSYQHMQFVTQKYGWSLILLNKTNLHQYISNYTYFQSIASKGIRQTVTQLSDLIRITVIEQNGGVYMDFSCVMYNDLSWLENQQSFRHLVLNRYGNNTDDPDLFIFDEGWLQSRSSYRNSQGVLIKQYPGYAAWFIAGKKKSKIMTDWKNHFYEMIQTPFNVYFKRFTEIGIYQHGRQFDGGDYLSLYHSLTQTLYNKQKQLDKNISLFGHRTTAHQFYKIWAVYGEVGPLLLTRFHIVTYKNLFQNTIPQLQEKTGNLYFFLKINGKYRQQIQEAFHTLNKTFINDDFNFKRFIQNGPTQIQCQSLNFIIQDSIIHKLINSSITGKKQKFPIITTSQRTQFKNYCYNHHYLKQNFIWNYDINWIWRILIFSAGRRSNPQQALYYNDKQTLLEYLKFSWLENDYIIYSVIYSMGLTIVLFSIFSVGKSFSMFIFKKFFNKTQQNSPKYTTHNNQIRLKSQKKSKLVLFFLIFLRLVSLIMSMLLYYFVDIQSSFPRHRQTFWICLIVVIIDKIVVKMKDSYQKQYFLGLKLNQIYTITNFAIYFSLIDVSLLVVEKTSKIMFFNIVIIVGLSPCLIKAIKKYNTQGFINKYLKSITSKLQGKYAYFLCAFLLIINIMPNIKFVVWNNRYLIEKVIYIPLAYVFFLFIGVAINTFQIFLSQSKVILISPDKLFNEIRYITEFLLVFLIGYEAYRARNYQSYFILEIRNFYFYYFISYVTLLYVQMQQKLSSKYFKQGHLVFLKIQYMASFSLLILFICIPITIQQGWNNSDKFILRYLLIIINLILILSFRQVFKESQKNQYQKKDYQDEYLKRSNQLNRASGENENQEKQTQQFQNQDQKLILSRNHEEDIMLQQNLDIINDSITNKK